MTVEVKAVVLREWPIKLTLCKVSRRQTSRKIHAEGIVCHRNELRNCHRLSCSRLGSRLFDEAVWYLVDVGIELRQVHAMSPSVSHIDKETRGQLALKIQIPLLHRPILLDCVPCCRETLLSENECRRRRWRVSAGRDDQRGAERTWSRARKDTSR